MAVKKFKDIEAVKKAVQKHEYFGDFITVGKERFQIVEYSMEGVGGDRKGGSRWVTYYNPYTGNQIYNDYAEGTVEYDKTFIAWEKDLPLDMKWLKGKK